MKRVFTACVIPSFRKILTYPRFLTAWSPCFPRRYSRIPRNQDRGNTASMKREEQRYSVLLSMRYATFRIVLSLSAKNRSVFGIDWASASRIADVFVSSTLLTWQLRCTRKLVSRPKFLESLLNSPSDYPSARFHNVTKGRHVYSVITSNPWYKRANITMMMAVSTTRKDSEAVWTVRLSAATIKAQHKRKAQYRLNSFFLLILITIFFFIEGSPADLNQRAFAPLAGLFEILAYNAMLSDFQPPPSTRAVPKRVHLSHCSDQFLY